MSGDVLIVGTGMTAFGRYPDMRTVDIGRDAALMALDDADLNMGDIDALYCGNVIEANYMIGQQILREIGQTGIPVVNCANACATGATAVREGYALIKAGLADMVLCLGVEKMGKGMIAATPPASGFQPEGNLGSESNPSLFAMLGMEHASRYGTTFEQFAQVSVKNHHHATLNDKAIYRSETPLEQVMSAEMIAYPNTKLMCSVNVDGAAAVVLASEKTARRRGLMNRAVRIRASVLASDPFEERNLTIFNFNDITRLAARKAYEAAELGPEDLDLVELHDCFATAEILHYGNLGLCKPEDAGPLIESGKTTLGGAVPVNVSGGLLSKGHPLGATGIANMYEICLQVRGEAGLRQVEGARIGLTHVVGNGSAAGVHILEKA